MSQKSLIKTTNSRLTNRQNLVVLDFLASHRLQTSFYSLCWHFCHLCHWYWKESQKSEAGCCKGLRLFLRSNSGGIVVNVYDPIISAFKIHVYLRSRKSSTNSGVNKPRARCEVILNQSQVSVQVTWPASTNQVRAGCYSVTCDMFTWQASCHRLGFCHTSEDVTIKYV